MVNPSDYMLHVPLLPKVAAGILDPRQVVVPLRAALARIKLILGSAIGIDPGDHTSTVVDVEGRNRDVSWGLPGWRQRDPLLSIPGVAGHAKESSRSPKASTPAAAAVGRADR